MKTVCACNTSIINSDQREQQRLQRSMNNSACDTQQHEQSRNTQQLVSSCQYHYYHYHCYHTLPLLPQPLPKSVPESFTVALTVTLMAPGPRNTLVPTAHGRENYN